jgi:hypothetical protein
VNIFSKNSHSDQLWIRGKLSVKLLLEVNQQLVASVPKWVTLCHVLRTKPDTVDSHRVCTNCVGWVGYVSEEPCSSVHRRGERNPISVSGNLSVYYYQYNYNFNKSSKIQETTILIIFWQRVQKAYARVSQFILKYEWKLLITGGVPYCV